MPPKLERVVAFIGIAPEYLSYAREGFAGRASLSGRVVGHMSILDVQERSMSSDKHQPPPSEASPEELRTNPRLLALIYDSTADPVYLVRIERGGQYRFVSVNEAFLRVTGYRVGQVIDAPMERVVPAANIGLVRSQYEQAIATRQSVLYEETAELPAGTRYAEITLVPIFEGSGPVTHIFAYIRDITARRIIEREREQLLSNAVFLSDATRLLASLDIEHALGDVARLAVPFLGDGCAIDFLCDGGPRRVVAFALDPCNPMFVDVHPTVLGGNALAYRVGATPCLGVPLLVKGRVMGAITLRAPADRQYTRIDLQLVEELGRRAAMAIDNARLYRHAQDALRARDDFLTVAAHEIRGPITTIHLAVQALLQGKLPQETLPRTLELIEREDRRLSRLVTELLDLGQWRSSQLDLAFEDVSLADVVQEVVKRLGAELAACGSPLTITAQPDVIGEWDRFRLEQVVTNVLFNAIKFGLGEPIEISVATVDGRARLSVVDHGIGIDPAARERIFNPFERNVSVRHYGGLGIGLHIVKTIVVALGGSVRVEGEPGAGSTFIVELPLRRTRVEPCES
jgi:PAS domain S-box-containing protein